MKRARVLTLLVSYCICLLAAAFLGVVSTPVQVSADGNPPDTPAKDSVNPAPAYIGLETEQPFEEANSSAENIIPIWELTRLSLVAL